MALSLLPELSGDVCKSIVALMGGATLLVASVPGLANAQTGGLYQQYGQPAVYLYQNGSLHLIPSATLFKDMGLSWNMVQHVSALPYRIGQPVELIQQAGNPAVYLVRNNTLLHIPSAQAFTQAGFQWGNIFRVTYLPPYPHDTFAQNTGLSWTPSNSYVTFNLLVPSGYTWTAEKSPYRSIGEVWNTSGGQIAVSLNADSVNSSYVFPGTILKSGGDGGNQVTLWQANGQIHGTEQVSIGTTQYGWRNPLGNPTQDQTLLLNVTLPNTSQNEITVENVLASWTLQDTNTGATYAGNQPPGHRWLPGWSANPLTNNNRSLMPQWLRTVNWGE